jgi:hypothetical protein
LITLEERLLVELVVLADQADQEVLAELVDPAELVDLVVQEALHLEVLHLEGVLHVEDLLEVALEVLVLVVLVLKVLFLLVVV